MKLAHIEAVMAILHNHLGKSTKHKKEGENSFDCPFCNHHKKKLQVNVESQKWHCWVCNAKGLAISSLLRRSKAPQHIFPKLKEIYGDSAIKNHNGKQAQTVCTLPDTYRPLYIKNNTPHYRNALHYAMVNRGLSLVDIVKYEVGYCEGGLYGGMLIVPSYDENGLLNFFTGRSFYETATFKHKNPSASKDVVGFDSHINWNEPVTIVEGAYDAITTKRNAIPLFGKRILPILRGKIVNNKPPILNLALDPDAYRDSLEQIEYFLNNGINVHYVDLKDKDPNEAGYVDMLNLIDNSQEVSFFDLIKYKMSI